jgi:hypothetical protein
VKKILRLLITMEFIHVAVIIGLLVQGGSTQEDVMFTGPESINVNVGEEAVLTCKTEVDYKFCNFRSPAGAQYNMDPLLPYEEGRIVYGGVNQLRDCAVRIVSITEEDNGAWECSIVAVVDGTPRQGKGSATITVNKAPTAVKLMVDGQETQTMKLNFPDEATKQVKCMAEGGRPAPSFSWQLGGEPLQGDVMDD